MVRTNSHKASQGNHEPYIISLKNMNRLFIIIILFCAFSALAFPCVYCLANNGCYSDYVFWPEILVLWDIVLTGPLPIADIVFDLKLPNPEGMFALAHCFGVFFMVCLIYLIGAKTRTKFLLLLQKIPLLWFISLCVGGLLWWFFWGFVRLFILTDFFGI